MGILPLKSFFMEQEASYLRSKIRISKQLPWICLAWGANILCLPYTSLCELLSAQVVILGHKVRRLYPFLPLEHQQQQKQEQEQEQKQDQP